jgi:replicative DNA helicase
MAVRSRARRIKQKHELDLVVVDYLQLMSHPKAESRQQEISNISRSLKELARELEVPVIAHSQLSRAVESRDDKRPQLSDLRESGSIEQDADVVLLLFRPEYYNQTDENRGLAEIICAKQRNGPTGNVRLQFFGSILRFENRAPEMGEAF